MAQGHDARLAELVTELGGNEVRFLFRDLVEKALQELIDAELTEAIGPNLMSALRRGRTAGTGLVLGCCRPRPVMSS